MSQVDLGGDCGELENIILSKKAQQLWFELIITMLKVGPCYQIFQLY